MKNGHRRNLRPIAELDLSTFEPPVIKGNRGIFIRAVWYIINALFFLNPILGLIPSRIKSALLRSFGAKVGRNFVCKPRTSFKYPWFIEIGDNTWIGEQVWIDNHCSVRIGSNVCISQGAYIFTGNHDWNDPKFAFFSKPVEIGDGAWIAAFQIVRPGSKIPAHHVMLGLNK